MEDACVSLKKAYSITYVRISYDLVLVRQLGMVRLVTHNLLACHAKGCTTNNFPLLLEDIQIELHEQDFNPDFIRNILPRLEWRALVDAATLASVRISSSQAHVLK
jgi:hypothetical protein